MCDKSSSPKWHPDPVCCFLCTVGSCTATVHDTIRLRVHQNPQVNILDFGDEWQRYPDCIALPNHFKGHPITHVMIYSLVANHLERVPTLILLACLAAFEDKQVSASHQAEYNEQAARIKSFQIEIERRNRDNEANTRSINRITNKTDWEVSDLLVNAIANIRQSRLPKNSHPIHGMPIRGTHNVYGYLAPGNHTATYRPPPWLQSTIRMRWNPNQIWPMEIQQITSATVTFDHPISLKRALEWTNLARQDGFGDNVHITLNGNESPQQPPSANIASMPTVTDGFQPSKSNMSSTVATLEEKLRDLSLGAPQNSRNGEAGDESEINDFKDCTPKLFSYEDLPTTDRSLYPDNNAERLAALERDLAELREQIKRLEISQESSSWERTSNPEDSWLH